MFAPSVPPSASTPTPTPTLPPTTCTPGDGGVPDSAAGNLLCGSWAVDAPSAIWQFVLGHRPLALAAGAVLLGVRLGWMAWRRRVWGSYAAQARWLAVVPPVTATPTATVGLWRLLATLLPAPRRLTWRVHRLVWEVQADPHGMRCGLWLPPAVNPTAVVRVLQRAWPGVRAEQTTPPHVSNRQPVAAVALLVARPEWQPLLDDDPTRASWRPGGVADEEDDRLRAVFDGLASAGRTGGGLLQVHVCRAPRHRLAMLRRATVNPDRARRTRGASRAVGLLAGALRAGLLAVLDIVTPGPSGRRPAPGRTDPYTAELARQARTKLAAAPHLLVAVRATAIGPTAAAARAAADDITSGFALLSAHFTRRRVRRAASAATGRWLPPSRMTLASVNEVAALAGLPAEPAAYGLPAAASRRRAAGREVFTAGPTTTGTPRPRRRPESDTSADEPPALWSAP